MDGVSALSLAHAEQLRCFGSTAIGFVGCVDVFAVVRWVIFWIFRIFAALSVDQIFCFSVGARISLKRFCVSLVTAFFVIVFIFFGSLGLTNDAVSYVETTTGIQCFSIIMH